jgi:quinol---cytochrome c reductase iron-sulfur subunit
MNAAKARAIAAASIVAMLGSLSFVAAYATGGDRVFEGLAVAFAAAGLSGAALGWAFWVFPAERTVEPRETLSSTPQERQAEREELRRDAENFSRRRALSRFLYAALGLFGIALAVPLRSLGPRVDDVLFHTKWRKGSRLMRENGSFVRTDDLEPDSVVTVFPEDAPGDAQSQTVLVRVPPGASDSTEGFFAYSKVCTHAGCPVALYRAQARQLMCPCHQSVFNVVDDGAVVSGPADHALPRLPLEVGDDGFLRAAGDYPTPVGPGFWERG